MNKITIYKILYYICFIISILIWFGTKSIIKDFGTYIGTYTNSFYAIINIVLVIIFSLKLIKKRLDKVNILFPVFYIIFCIIVTIICFIMNTKLVVPYIQFSYYIGFILFNYILLNIYSILSLNKSKSIYK